MLFLSPNQQCQSTSSLSVLLFLNTKCKHVSEEALLNTLNDWLLTASTRCTSFVNLVLSDIVTPYVLFVKAHQEITLVFITVTSLVKKLKLKPVHFPKNCPTVKILEP